MRIFFLDGDAKKLKDVLSSIQHAKVDEDDDDDKTKQRKIL